MEATHYNPVLKFGCSTFHGGVKPIDFFGEEIGLNLIFGIDLVAVWRIKPTDVPLQERLMRRHLERFSSTTPYYAY